jgi:hypothetical protein
MEMKKWASKVKRTIKEDGGGRGRRKSTNLAIVSANNHYAGFGPETANIFRKMVQLPGKLYGKKWRRRKRTTNRTYRVTYISTIQNKGPCQIS